MPDTWQPPRGIRYEAGRPSAPFLLRWDEAGKRRSQSFATAEDRETAAKALADKRAEHGREVLTFDPREWRRWLEFKDAIGDADPFDVLREWQIARSNAGSPVGKLTVADAVAQYVAFRAQGKLSADTRRHIDKHVRERFGLTHAGLKLRDITPAKITTWLDSLRSSKGANKGKPVEPLTRRHHRKDLNTFFDYCVTQGWLQRNPCALVAVPHVEETDVELLTVEEGISLFANNENYPVVGRMALEAFGFIRASRAGYIRREEINFAERGILFKGAGRKGTKARFRQGHPDNLWAWLNRAPDETWDMTFSQYRHAKALAFARAGLSGSDNRLRKTCLSAYVAMTKNPVGAAHLSTHRHPSTTDIYLGVMTEAEGRAWFEIGPRFIP
jgi:site-specific recombinase XerC